MGDHVSYLPVFMWMDCSSRTQQPTLSATPAPLADELLQDSPGPAHSVLLDSTRPIRHASITYGYARHLSIPFLSFEIFQLMSPLLPSLYLQVEGSFYPSRYFSKASERRGYKPEHSFFFFSIVWTRGKTLDPLGAQIALHFPSACSTHCLEDGAIHFTSGNLNLLPVAQG